MLQVFKGKSLRLSVCLSLAIFSVLGCAFATGSGGEEIAEITEMTVKQLTVVQQALLSLISDIVPVALVVMGSVLVVTLGIRFFRRFAG